MKLIRLASLQLSSTSTPSSLAIWCWLSMRLPTLASALNTTFRPLPDGVTYTSRMRSESCHFSNTSRGCSTWSMSITTSPVRRVAACLRQAPCLPAFEVVTSKVAWKMKAGSLRFSAASPVWRNRSMSSFHLVALTRAQKRASSTGNVGLLKFF